jgi:hypothetical protein
MLVAVDSMVRAARYADRHANMSAKGEFIERVTATAMREP